MEDVRLAEKIAVFLQIDSGWGSGCGDGSGYGWGYGWGSGCGDGSGYGSGSGRGYGWGYGSGSGSGDGCGDGSGSGSGDGSGDGSGSGIARINGKTVYQVDGVQTLFTSVRGNAARGFILNGDLTLSPCYIVKVENYFSHGETLKAAVAAAQAKYMENMPLEDRIEAFWAAHERGKKYPATDYFEWHHTLTGSCEMGRNSFVRNGGFDLERDKFTPEEFIEITKNAYGGDCIRKLEDFKKEGKNNG